MCLHYGQALIRVYYLFWEFESSLFAAYVCIKHNTGVFLPVSFTS